MPVTASSTISATAKYKLLMSRMITQHWMVVILVWLLIAIGLRWAAPPWDQIAADGDMDFLPRSVPSARGEQALEQAFPGSQSRSQMILVFAQPNHELTSGDLACALDITRRLHWLAAKSSWSQLRPRSDRDTLSVSNDSTSAIRQSFWMDVVRENLTQAIESEEALFELSQQIELMPPVARLPDAHLMRGRLLGRLGESEQSTLDLSSAELIRQRDDLLTASIPDWSSALRDVWSWRSGVVGHKLGKGHPQARLVNLEMSTDFAATANLAALAGVEQLVADVRRHYDGICSSGFRVEVSGSAAVGADMLRAAASGIRTTELVTAGLVLLILALVYRAPFLVAIPLISIALSLVVATSVVALLARDPIDPTSLGLGVFTTTRIFIVVLLFGVGTDFCLFFLARNRELLESKPVRSRRQMYRLVASGWRSVHDALVASAVTTIVGLALMWFSRFEKFQFSGPIIAISLAITVLVCLTFTPALLCGLGRTAFWPRLRGQRSAHEQVKTSVSSPARRYWQVLAAQVIQRPLPATLWTIGLLTLPAGFGVICLGKVTYDLHDELSESAASRRGAKLIGSYFPTREGSPITVLVTRQMPFADQAAMQQACTTLSGRLYVDGVQAVRSLTDPLGDYPPGKRMSLFAQDAWRRRLLNSIAQEHFVSSVGAQHNRVAKFDVVLQDSPFSLEAGATLSRLRDRLASETGRNESPWSDAVVTMSGTTVGITDLRSVTQADQRRIQLLVTAGVWAVLVLMLRRVILSTYLVFTVLLSYFATLGVTYALFAILYGSDYAGLDWKVPIFLFVILVAVGQDYNVYLVTRIFEERRAANIVEAVRIALEQTGGIITSCGVVMAGTFVAMTSPAVLHWLGQQLPAGWIATDAPVLRGITELGFALAFGVLLDTLVIRTVLVPAFVLLQGRSGGSRSTTTAS